MAVALSSNFCKLSNDEIGAILCFCDWSGREKMKTVDRKIYTILESFLFECVALIKKTIYPSGPDSPRCQLSEQCCALEKVRFIPTSEIADSRTLITCIVSWASLGINKLYLRDLHYPVLTDDVLLAIEEHLPNIEAISLHRSMISNEAVGSLLKNCLQLKSFSISDCSNVDGKGWVMPKESNLIKVFISHLPFIHCDCISSFLKINGLEEFSIVDSSVERTFDEWGVSENSALTKASFSRCTGVYDYNIRALIQAPKLQILNCDDNNANIMTGRRGLPFSKAIALTQVHVTDRIGPVVGEFMKLGQLLSAPNLETLSIGTCSLIVPIRFIKLRILIIDKSPYLTDDIIKMFLKYAPNLERFEIGDGCTLVSRSIRDYVKKHLRMM